MSETFEENSTPEAKEERRQELLRQGKGLEAIRYALREGLTFVDADTYVALQAIIDAQDRAEAAGDEIEFNLLQAEYDRIWEWRMEGRPRSIFEE